jgi:16S rRNA processing protein RimM
VGRAHGLDGSFYVESPVVELLEEGAALNVVGRAVAVVRRAGTDARPIVRLDGIDDRDAAEALRGEELRTAAEGGDEAGWEIAELVGCEVPGLGSVRRVLQNPSCDVLEVGDEGTLVPLVADAVKRVDTEARRIDVDLRFIGIDDPPAAEAPE